MAGLAIRDDARLAGLVSRYHTWPRTREQSVAEHSWQVARILMAIAPRDWWGVLLPHAIVHDIGEVGTGDVPYPVKARNHELGRLFEELEHATAQEICERWTLPMPIRDWDRDLRWVFKMAEFIEMWEWGLEELLRGNQLARLVAERCRAVIDTMLEEHVSAEIPLSGESGVTELGRLTMAYVARREEMWNV